MRTIKFLFLALIIISVSSCTKEVPENNRKVIKTVDDLSISKTINGFFEAYNTNNLDSLTYYFDTDYKGFVADSDDAVGLQSTISDLKQYRKRYPEGKWEYKIEEINAGGNFAEALTTASFMRPGITGKTAPAYSERSIRILKKQKDDGWKIFRYMAIPTFTYDSN